MKYLWLKNDKMKFKVFLEITDYWSNDCLTEKPIEENIRKAINKGYSSYGDWVFVGFHSISDSSL